MIIQKSKAVFNEKISNYFLHLTILNTGVKSQWSMEGGDMPDPIKFKDCEIVGNEKLKCDIVIPGPTTTVEYDEITNRDIIRGPTSAVVYIDKMSEDAKIEVAMTEWGDSFCSTEDKCKKYKKEIFNDTKIADLRFADPNVMKEIISNQKKLYNQTMTILNMIEGDPKEFRVTTSDRKTVLIYYKGENEPFVSLSPSPYKEQDWVFVKISRKEEAMNINISAVFPDKEHVSVLKQKINGFLNTDKFEVNDYSKVR